MPEYKVETLYLGKGTVLEYKVPSVSTHHYAGAQALILVLGHQV